jgi:hypothetical protein
MIIEMTGTPSKVDNFLAVLRPFGIKEMMRGGTIAMARGVPQQRQQRRLRSVTAVGSYSYAGSYSTPTPEEPPTAQADGVA